MLENRTIAIRVAFVYAYTATTLDDVLDVVDMLITDITVSAKALAQKTEFGARELVYELRGKKFRFD